MTNGQQMPKYMIKLSVCEHCGKGRTKQRAERKPFISVNLVCKKGSISHHGRNDDRFHFSFYISLY